MGVLRVAWRRVVRAPRREGLCARRAALGKVLGTALGLVFGVLLLSACRHSPSSPSAGPSQPSAPSEPVTEQGFASDAGPQPTGVKPSFDRAGDTLVAVWQRGAVTGSVRASDAPARGWLVMDLADAWTPYLFTERGSSLEPLLPNRYRATYIALANAEFGRDKHGSRATKDKYLELYGIPPSIRALQTRFAAVAARECRQTLNLEPLAAFTGFITYQSNPKAKKDAAQFQYLARAVRKLLAQHRVDEVQQLAPLLSKDSDRQIVQQYLRQQPVVEVIRAVQARLQCEGYFQDKPKPIEGAMDWVTHEALAEFEKRHRVYGWGYIGKETLEALRVDGLELERRAVVRVLTERAIHAAGVLEDGSTSSLPDGSPRTFVGKDGQRHPVPNLEAEIQSNVVQAFGLQTVESTAKWLQAVAIPKSEKPFWVAVQAPRLPEYYAAHMPLKVTIDRGDIWYDFPFDEQGRELPQPVKRRPALTVWVEYLNQSIPIARVGTTVGGWRSEFVGGQHYWRYKESPHGSRIWSQIVAAPVWIPPENTPPKDILEKIKKNKYEIDYHDIGPSYASAYGLAAAYHLKYTRNRSGEIVPGADEGIRTHGSVDYMSIRRRHSHGCHRLHNHLAVRLMSFVLMHHPHLRVGQDKARVDRLIEYEGKTYRLKIDEGGYVFRLQPPLVVEVLEGHVVGAQKAPLPFAVPKFDADAGAYVTADGGAVVVRQGQLVAVPLPTPPAALLDAGVLPNVTAPSATMPSGATAPTSGVPVNQTLLPAPAAPP